MRYFLLLPAIVLDFIQFAVGMAFFALQFATPVGGGVTGALAAGAYCWNASTGVISGLIAAGKCAVGGAVVGAGVSAFAIPIGIVVDVALSITIGGALIMMMAMFGLFYPRIIISRMLGELAPFLNFLPLWSNMVWACIQAKNKEEKAGTSKNAFGFVKARGEGPYGLKHNAQLVAQRRFAPAQKFDTTAHQKVREVLRTPLLDKFKDIRPAAKGAVLALLLFVGIQAHAQVVPAPIQYIVAPETPGAYEKVIISVQGVGSFLGSADITWSLNGKVVKEGIGERDYTFMTGALGEKTTVQVAIDSSQGFFTQTFSFNPSRINLLWEAYTTVPPLYKGKALYSAGSDYKVVALPTVYSGSARVAASALSYQWFYKGDSVPEQSGLGRNTFTNTGDQLQAGEDIAVEVYYGVNKVGRAELFLATRDPLIVLYQRDALRGVLYNTAIPSAISLAGKEITLQAEPYYFSAASKKAGLIPFVWTLNDTETTGPDSARGILTLRQTGSGEGRATVGVSMQNGNADQLIQTASAALQIVFGAQSNGLFDFIGL